MKKGKKTTRRKAHSSKETAKLKKITAEAKRIYKKYPRKKWTTCVKEAAKKVK